MPPGISSNPFITLENVTVRLGRRWLLAGTNWQIMQERNWVVTGPNGAGKTTPALEDLTERPMVQLSFGQQRLILIARAVVKTPQVLILDEPCNGLDADHRRAVLHMLEQIARNVTYPLALCKPSKN